MRRCDQWLSDGTFRSVPNIFTQLYTIHGFKDGKSVPLVYLLAPNMSKCTDVEFLSLIRQSLPNYSPLRIMMDFEKAFIGACEEIYPRVKFSGCNFHYNNVYGDTFK